MAGSSRAHAEESSYDARTYPHAPAGTFPLLKEQERQYLAPVQFWSQCVPANEDDELQRDPYASPL